MKKALIAAFFTSIALGACRENPEDYEMTFAERSHIDTLYMKETIELRPGLDSLCLRQTDSLIRTALDSILKVRKEEEIALRRRIQGQSRQGNPTQ